MIVADSVINHLVERSHMRKTSFVVREVCDGRRSLEEIFASLILCDTALTADTESVIIE